MFTFFSNPNFSQSGVCYLLEEEGEKSKQTHKRIFKNAGLSVFLANLASESHFSPFLERLGFHAFKKQSIRYEATQRSGFGFGMTSQPQLHLQRNLVEFVEKMEEFAFQ